MLLRIRNIFVILLLIFGTSGITITRHYCGTNLVSTSLYSTPEDCCDNCPYCHNEKISFRITDNFESFQAKPTLAASVKILLDHNTLPVILAFSDTPLVSDKMTGGQVIKPNPANRFAAGNTSPFLQVFLF
jgi:hypothetical protein